MKRAKKAPAPELTPMQFGALLHIARTGACVLGPLRLAEFDQAIADLESAKLIRRSPLGRECSYSITTRGIRAVNGT